MSKIKELENILKDDVLIEVNDEIKAIENMLQKKQDKDLEIELEYYKDIKKFYDEALNQISRNELSEEEANNILLDLEDMRADEDEI
ncbi:hypothetical protein ACNSOS_11200 [Aliarcobacter vitoriensis]|uniref:Uncharacterized protein n=1 Tax=Aliarcobacter vitoriensis TaxID=2011099 RepID=A0A366MUV3_9BACT|nr:hypothetical protein [Aliarcobacter vitoriensis]RBQ29259.1 hypothetical protein CRU91_05375 [Aliarcobacter vitoriensis]RBQ30954.1 hypothetical protein CRU92_09670 [Arcobacter sp. FW59]